jgi:hypothetical protein
VAVFKYECLPSKTTDIAASWRIFKVFLGDVFCGFFWKLQLTLSGDFSKKLWRVFLLKKTSLNQQDNKVVVANATRSPAPVTTINTKKIKNQKKLCFACFSEYLSY